MSASSDEAKGRIKQAVGDLTDDDRLRHDGKVDQAVGKAKSLVDRLRDKLQHRH